MAKSAAERQAEARKKRDVTVESLRHEIGLLQAEVASLKRQLAEARKGEWDARTRSGEVVLTAARAVGAVAASQNASKSTFTPHGAHCQCLGCR